MKTLFLKNAGPFAVVILALSGAFATTSMQKAKDALPKIGYVLNPDGSCSNITRDCEDEPSEFTCRINDVGAQVWGKDPNGECTEKLYRPEQPN
ncbi:DUF6520 family protein [Flavobacterium sp. FlaQc-28]|uniref:DUF6520 family protein n=1 Tax=Flavobacterium sp. FlaQc-28 TaxID=3374178 RepID=UPI0037572FDA